MLVLAAVGISTIVVNDNPVKWFEKKHPIRVADRILNEHFGGTYMAYLVLQEKSDPARFQNSLDILRSDLDRWVEDLKAEIPQLEKVKEPAAEWIDRAQGKERRSFSSLLQDLETAALREMERDTPEAEAWDEISLLFNAQKVAHQPFKNPEVLHTLEALEQTLMDSGAVGKVNSLVDVVKKVHYELMGGDKTFNVIPKTAPAVAQTLLSFQNSHNPDDLWHLVTPDYQKANLWVQLKSGDNKDMEPVLAAVRKFFEDSSVALDYQWAGLTYLNVIWQDKMVNGMMRSLLGSFVIVGLIAAFLFRSPLRGLLCMVPLTVTISFIYGMIGFVGKDYDMPVAVLSAMTLGLSVDFAIHFLQRSRVMYETSNNNWESTSRAMFGEPARAISRNILVIAIGFTPLMVSPLIPYQTVGFLLASIMLISGFATLMILPALMRVFEHRLFLKNG